MTQSTPGQPAIKNVDDWTQGPEKADQIKTMRTFNIDTPGQVRDYGKLVGNRKFQKFEGTKQDPDDLTANDIKDWALQESTINKFKDKYQTNWRIELDKAVAEMLSSVKSYK